MTLQDFTCHVNLSNVINSCQYVKEDKPWRMYAQQYSSAARTFQIRIKDTFEKMELFYPKLVQQVLVGRISRNDLHL